MNTKRILALLAALLMLVCLFAGCSNDSGKTDDSANQGQTNDKTDDKNKPDDTNDNPDEDELETITYLAYARSDNYTTWINAESHANLAKCIENQHQYGFEVDTSFCDPEVYTSTETSLAAAGTLPQVFGTYGAIDSSTLVDWTDRGMLLSCSEVLECSSGNMIKAFGADGMYDWARAKATHHDGDWYIVMITNNPARGLRITEEDGEYRVNVQLHGIYAWPIRQDWLDDLGLDMPTTPQEYFDACLQMHEQDVNGNGQNDERIIVGLGTEYQQQGPGFWYGLPYQDFFSDPTSGQVEVGMLYEGYADWATYMAQFYDAGMLYANEGGHPWENTQTFIAENNCISWEMQANAIWSQGRNNTGDEDAYYKPMPIIAAVDGVKARVLAQDATAAEWGMSFNSQTCSPETAAKFTDCVYSYEQFLLRYYGIEGVAWEYEEDGVHIDDFKTHEGYVKGDIPLDYMSVDSIDNSWANFLGYFPVPYFKDLWDPTAVTYYSAQEAIDAGEPYAEGSTTREVWIANQIPAIDYDQPNWQTLNAIAEYGEKNINFACYYDFETLPTAEEAVIQSELGADLKTYVIEVGTKLIIGDYNVAELQSYIDYAYDNLGLQEYLDIQQARVDRFFEAMGR